MANYTDHIHARMEKPAVLEGFLLKEEVTVEHLDERIGPDPFCMQEIVDFMGDARKNSRLRIRAVYRPTSFSMRPCEVV